ncbi:MAG: DUF6712 family protein [Agriterribacter sp.]
MPLNPDSFKTLFISEQALKDNSIIDNNTDAKILLPIIKKSQDLFLHPLLSTKLFEDLQTKIAGETLNQDEKDLIETYIQPALIFKIQSESIFDSTFRQKNKGVGTMSTNGFNPATLDEVKYLSERADNSAEEYGQRLVKYLKANKATFPKYEECVDACSPDIPAQKSAYRCKIFLG